jgi:hypothetical protein
VPQVHPDPHDPQRPGDDVAPGASPHSRLLRESGGGAGILVDDTIPIPKADSGASGATGTASEAARSSPPEPARPFGACGHVHLAVMARAVHKNVQAIDQAHRGPDPRP